MRRSASEIIRNLEQRIARLERQATTNRQAGKGPFIVMWFDPNNSVQKKGEVEYKGKTVFNSRREAQEALEYERDMELDYDPDSEMTFEIFERR